MWDMVHSVFGLFMKKCIAIAIADTTPTVIFVGFGNSVEANAMINAVTT